MTGREGVAHRINVVAVVFHAQMPFNRLSQTGLSATCTMPMFASVSFPESLMDLQYLPASHRAGHFDA